MELVRLEIPPLLRDHLCLSFPLQLVLLYPSILINSIYKLTHTDNRFTRQRFPQIMLGWEMTFLLERILDYHIQFLSLLLIPFPL